MNLDFNRDLLEKMPEAVLKEVRSVSGWNCYVAYVKNSKSENKWKGKDD